ncbi:heme o synthase [Ichthyobacterium seriolicida]|nr:heme o synthase [Ichthyobacterium seriolicida]
MFTKIQSALSVRAFSVSFSELKELTKFGLSLSVVFSSVCSYILASTTIDWYGLLKLILGGYLVVGSSNIFNQIIERDLDKLMNRTKNRPLPSGRISVDKSLFIGFSFISIGLCLLYSLNAKAAIFSGLSSILYVFAYTPLKSVTPLSVFIGAFPGAMPAALGWVASTNSFGVEAGFLFAFQFIWQFPHFWAVAILLHEDYKRSGFKLLPSKEKDGVVMSLIFLYTLCLIPISVFPVMDVFNSLKISYVSATIIALSGVGFLSFSIRLIDRKDDSSARNLMFAGLIYLPLVQLVYVINNLMK